MGTGGSSASAMRGIMQGPASAFYRNRSGGTSTRTILRLVIVVVVNGQIQKAITYLHSVDARATQLYEHCFCHQACSPKKRSSQLTATVVQAP